MKFQYIRIAEELESKILDGTYHVGDRLPSIANIRERLKVNKATVYSAYLLLEKKGLIEARPKSGFYVKADPYRLFSSSGNAKNSLIPQKLIIDNLISSIIDDMSNPSLIPFGGISISQDLAPKKEIANALKSIANNKLDQVISFGKNIGTETLRREIMKRNMGYSRNLGIDDLVITRGRNQAVSICLQAVAKPGDIIAVESPTFYSLLQVINDLDMHALEIPTNSETGIDISKLSEILKKGDVTACLFSPNCQNPLGFILSDVKKKELVELVTSLDIPIIEDDCFGELTHAKERPSTLKSYDRTGVILHCASFAKTISQGLDVGWVIPGKYNNIVQRIKLNFSFPTPNLNQLIISEFLQNYSYDRHLRKLRKAMKRQVEKTAQAIDKNFPEGTKLNKPKGGCVLWVELDPKYDSMEIYNKAKCEHIAILPGVIFSNSGKYKNYIRINCGHPWSEKLNQGIITLSEIIKKLGKG